MVRPALLGSHPRGPQYRGVQVPPHYGNRPRWRKERTTYLTQCKNPKSIVPALSRSEMTIQDRRYHSRHQRKSNQTIIQDRVAQHNRHLHQTIHHARTLPGGNHAECFFGPLPSHPFPLVFPPPLSPSCPVHSPTTSPLFPSPFSPLF